jgi:formylmethanofuran dehydrogenase subunit E
MPVGVGVALACGTALNVDRKNSVEAAAASPADLVIAAAVKVVAGSIVGVFLAVLQALGKIVNIRMKRKRLECLTIEYPPVLFSVESILLFGYGTKSIWKTCEKGTQTM